MIRMNLRNYVGKIAIVGFAALAIGTAIGAGILFYQKNELNGRVAALESQLESQVGGIARAQATAENSYDGLKDRVAALESQLESQVESIESIARAQATAENSYDGLKDRVAALESQLESQVGGIESIARAQATAEDR